MSKKRIQDLVYITVEEFLRQCDYAGHPIPEMIRNGEIEAWEIANEFKQALLLELEDD